MTQLATMSSSSRNFSVTLPQFVTWLVFSNFWYLVVYLVVVVVVVVVVIVVVVVVVVVVVYFVV